MTPTLSSAIAAFGSKAKEKLANPAASGQPEDQLRTPFEQLLGDVSEISNFGKAAVSAVGESSVSDLKTRPDFAVTVHNALVGFVELKAPGKGADPRKFKDSHDKLQWEKLSSLPNVMYTDGNTFSLWQNGQLVGSIVTLIGDIESSGNKLQDCPGSTDSSTGAWVVGIDPATGHSKFQVPVVSGTYRGTVRGDDSLCGTPGTQSGYNLSSPNGFSIAGDGYAYTSYIELDATSDVGEPPQTYPATAFGLFNQIAGAEWATNPSKAIADMATLAAMVPVANNIYHDFVQAEQAGDFQYAGQLLYGISARIRPYCTANNSKSYKLHVLRVGSDGSASDMVVHEWNAAFVGAFWNGNVMAGTTSYTFQQTGADPLTGITTHPIITNADSGALLSWEVFLPAYCASASIETGCTDNVPTSVEHHLTTMSGGGVGSDAIWNVPGVPNYEGYYWAVPSLQLQDGSYVGTASYVYPQFQMVNFDASGNIKWSVPNLNPQIATADGGLIAQSQDGSTTETLDAGGNATGESATLGQAFDWPGNAYYTANLSVSSDIGTPPDYVPTYAATSGSNQSGNGTSIWEVLSPIPPSSSPQHQIPPGADLHSNYNSIEILTTASADTIFSRYIQSFAGAGANPPDVNSVVSIVNTSLPVTGTGQNVTFRLKSWKNYLTCAIPPPIPLPCPAQGPFSVQTERFDTTAHTISVVTLTGHPLAGWRYWRVFAVGTNDLVVETGAVDTHAGTAFPHLINYAGFYIARADQVKTWEDDFRYILRDLVQSQTDANAIQGTNPQFNLVKGGRDSDPEVPTQSYILNNVCQSTSCN